jgi:hypothetical protein
MLAKWMNETEIDPNRYYDYLISSAEKKVSSYRLVKGKWVKTELIFNVFRQMDIDTFIVFAEEDGYSTGFKYIGYNIEMNNETRYMEMYVPFCEKLI